MNRIINKRQAICGIAWLIVLCVVLSLWPLRLVKETVVSGSNRQIVMESDEIVDGHAVQQMFVAQYDRLKNIDIYFTEGTVGETFNFVLYDASMNMIMQQEISTKDMKSIPGDCTVQINIDTEVGKAYYYLLQGMESPFRVAFEETAASGNRYNGALYYGNVEDEEHCIVASFSYEVPLRKGKTFVCYALFVMLGILVTVTAKKYYGKYPERNVLVTAEWAVKRVLNPLIAVAGVVAFAAVWPGRLFTTNTVSIVFYEVSILLAIGLLLYAVNHDRTGCASDRTVIILLRDNWQNYLQSVFFAGAIWACCNYMNGLFELHHTVAYRQMLIFLALAVLVTYKAGDLVNPVNALYCVAAGIVGYLYHQNAVAALQDPEELDFSVIRLTAWVGILAGLIVIGTIRFAVQGRIRGIAVGYGILVAGFFTLIILFRNTRGWPVYLVCAFTLFYLNMAAWEKKAELLRNICNGILFHFGTMVVYCLLHRPYMFFRYYRYPFVFHTVTISAVYLALVVCAAFVKFLDAYRRRPRLAAVYKELFLLGVSAVYLLFTLSRTGYLAIAVTAVVLIPVMCFANTSAARGKGRHLASGAQDEYGHADAGSDMPRQEQFAGRHGVQCMLRSIGMMAAAVILCFPVVFTAQRIVPAVVARPQLHEIEELPEEIVHGRDMDSYYYMTIQRFIQVFQMKILGIPEEESLRAIYMVADAEDVLSGHPSSDEETELLPVPMGDMTAGTDGVLLASAGNMAAGIDRRLLASVAGAAEDDGFLIASSDDAAVGENGGNGEPVGEESDAEDNYTNGRLDIFRVYYRNLNKFGHEDMGIMEPDGNYLVHAHNIYLQAAYDHGIYVGAVFILLGVGTLMQAAFYFHRHKEDRICAALPMALLILFAVAGLTEWIFHPCCPIACCLLLTLSPLLVDGRKAV